MKGLWLLSLRHVLHQRVQTTILALCIAVPVFLPIATRMLTARYDHELRARAASTPLVCGAKGNRFDLTLTSLWFRQSDIGTIPFRELQALEAAKLGLAIPLHVRFTARGWPVVATSPDYFEHRRLRAAAGTLPVVVGEAVLGCKVAAALGLGAGDSLFSDQRELYDISKPPALKMRISGVLRQAGTPDDHAVFVDTKTAWVLEGLAHGHEDPKRIDASLVLGRTGDHVQLSQAMIEYNEITPENAGSFHFHGDPAGLPLTSILFVPHDDKSRTLARSRTNVSKDWQMVAPADVIADLMAFVFRLRGLFDAFSIVLGTSTILMMGLVILLSMRIRRREMETLNHIGCSRGAVARLYVYEVVIVVLASLLLAGAGMLLARLVLPDLVRML